MTATALFESGGAARNVATETPAGSERTPEERSIRIRGGGGRKEGAKAVAAEDAGKTDGGTKGKKNGAAAMSRGGTERHLGEGGGGVSGARGNRYSREGG